MYEFYGPVGDTDSQTMVEEAMSTKWLESWGVCLPAIVVRKV